MNAAETLARYERQLAALDRMERILGRMTAAADQMAGAVQRAADRMGELLASTQKAAQSMNLKAPFDSLANTVSGKMQAGVDKLKEAITPQGLALSLALSLGWKLFGDDIMSVLNPAMTVLESFAGLVHSTLGALAPFFTPVVWAVELLAQGIDWMAAKMNTLMPIVLGLTAAMAIFHKATIASAMATKIHAAGTVLHTVVTKAHTVATNGLKLAQAALDMVLSTSPLGLIARLAGVAVGIFAAWTMRVGGLKNAIGILFNGIIGGINWVLELLNKITDGKGTMEDLDKITELAEFIKSNSLCGLGQTAPNPVLSTLRYFRDEYVEHIVNKRCPAGVCKALLNYKIDPVKCKGCTLCARTCPAGAISGTVRQPHTIDTAKCVKCGACIEKCKFGAISKG